MSHRCPPLGCAACEHIAAYKRDLDTLRLAWERRQLVRGAKGCGHSTALPGGMCAACQAALTLGAPAPQPTGQSPRLLDFDELSARKDWR